MLLNKLAVAFAIALSERASVGIDAIQKTFSSSLSNRHCPGARAEARIQARAYTQKYVLRKVSPSRRPVSAILAGHMMTASGSHELDCHRTLVDQHLLL